MVPKSEDISIKTNPRTSQKADTVDTSQLILRAAGPLLYGLSESEVGKDLVENESLTPENAWLIVRAAKVYINHPPKET